ncbi:hypothetical protein D7294_29175 [Streptomyces hoynatensis]|uniref:LPXTG cell wall anchor domain-containing protein n=2 Tax=Streptomyces hoynatensis TaxID=1141874 RepID=A0A3A9YJY2_9ACTN|nr:hypothetical protein D7294_29175 [Streptomyces hoynatensis]
MSLVGLGSTQAWADGHQQCGQVRVENSTDGGNTWTTEGRYNGEAPTAISVRLTGDVAEGCAYPVSLAAYSAEGPTWETSGQQEFLGWDTTTLTADAPEATLDVSDSAPACFGQIDLYAGGDKFDGTEGHALPHYPDSATPTGLIAAWNGGQPCEEEPTTPPGDEPTDEPGDEAPGDEPTDEPTDEAPTEEPAEDTPSPSESAADGVAPDTGGQEPVGQPIALPESTTPNGDLAETGGDGSQLTVFASAGAGLLVVGGAAAYFARRRNRATR